MASKKNPEIPSIPDPATLSIYEKLYLARERFIAEDIKKSGVNSHAEFEYYELEDIVPVALRIFAPLRCLFLTTFIDGRAKGILINLDDPSSTIEVGFDMKDIAEPAKFRMNEAQSRGAEITYYRRYLYMIILDIVDVDEIDSDTTPLSPPPSSRKPATTEKREEIKHNLTDTEGNADELQLNALKSACKKLLELDPTQEESIQKIAVETNGFTVCVKSRCEELVKVLSALVTAHGG